MNEPPVFSAIPFNACTCGVRIKESASLYTPEEQAPYHTKACAFRKGYQKWHASQSNMFKRILPRLEPVKIETW